MSNKVTSFVDSVGRVIVARLADDKSTDEKLAVTNPSVVNVNVNQESGQISVQLLPYIFREFIAADKRYDKHVWFFNKCQITSCEDFEIDDAVENQYIGIFETVPAPPEATDSPEAETVEVFEDEKPAKKAKEKATK